VNSAFGNKLRIIVKVFQRFDKEKLPLSGLMTGIGSQYEICVRGTDILLLRYILKHIFNNF
jgi:hypothetical protein